MSDVVRNILATAIVDNSTETKCLQPYVHTEEDVEDDWYVRFRERRDARREARRVRRTLGQFRMKKLQWHNDGDVICQPAGKLRPKNPPRGSDDPPLQNSQTPKVCRPQAG